MSQQGGKLFDYTISSHDFDKMATSALFSVVILGLSLVLKFEFSAAHAPAQLGADSSSNLATLSYLFIEDLHELQSGIKVLEEKIEILEEKLGDINAQGNENKMVTEKIDMLEGKLESLDISSEVKMIAQNVERLDEKLGNLNAQTNENTVMTDKMTEKNEILEGKQESLESLEISTEVKIIAQKFER